jgi:hypothetical protein
VRVPAGGLVNHQQMLILKNHARCHAQMKPFFNPQMKAWNHCGKISRQDAKARLKEIKRLLLAI